VVRGRVFRPGELGDLNQFLLRSGGGGGNGGICCGISFCLEVGDGILKMLPRGGGGEPEKGGDFGGVGACTRGGRRDGGGVGGADGGQVTGKVLGRTGEERGQLVEKVGHICDRGEGVHYLLLANEGGTGKKGPGLGPVGKDKGEFGGGPLRDQGGDSGDEGADGLFGRDNFLQFVH
jgi:hypothetical protein